MQDKLGREITIPYVARGALVTATATLTTGTPTTLIAGDTDYPLDILEVTFSNQSTVAALVTLLDDGTTVRTLEIQPGTVELCPHIPIIQGAKGGNWYVKMEDITGTTVTVDAILTKNT